MSVVRSSLEPANRAPSGPCDPPWAWTIREASEALRAGALSALDLVEAHLDRIAEVDRHLSAFIRLEAEAARREAERAAEEMAAGTWRGALHGMPFAVKDNYDVAGLPTTAGSRLSSGSAAERDADLVSRLREAGAICLGKLSTWEYGTGNGGEYFDLPFPPARNPWDTARFSGGSSTGAGVAVAAGLVKFALGSDTTGSVRLPAAATGVVGVVPSPGRLSLAGILPNCYSLDVPGPLAWTADDVAIVLACLAGDARIDARAGSRGLRIGIVRQPEPGLPEPDAELRAAFEEGLGVLEREGFRLRDVALPVPAAECFAATRIIGPAESAAIHERELREQPDAMGFALRDKLIAGSLVRAVDYIAAQRRRREIADGIEALFGEIDLLVTYGSLHLAPRLGIEPEMTAFTTDTMLTPFSLSGHPSLVQCTGFSRAGLPLHWQMAAGRGQEARLLAAAAAYERATSWRERRPEPSAPPESPPASYPDMASGDRALAGAFARRHGLDRLTDRHLARLAALQDGVAAAGLVLARPARKSDAPAATFTPRTPETAETERTNDVRHTH